MAKPSALTAVKKLELSQLDPGTIQRELMGPDIDLEKLTVYLKSQIKFDAIERVIDVKPTRTIDGASTVVVSLNDYDRSILQSGELNNRLDINIDGLWFRLVSVGRSVGDDQLDLTFEQREIAILRTYPKKGTPHNGVKFAHRSKVTRAEFILGMIREVKELEIPVVIPELHKVQAIQKQTDQPAFGLGSGGVGATPGIPTNYNVAAAEAFHHREPGTVAPRGGLLTVKGATATSEQIRNANTIITVGQSMGARRKVLVCAIMTAIQESVLINLPSGDKDSVGLFQQRRNWGSYRDRHDPATAARLFFKRAIKEDMLEPSVPYWTLCQDVQGSEFPEAYARWRTEGERFVNAYGIVGGDTEGSAAEANNMKIADSTGSDFIYYRGKPSDGGKIWKREDNWECITRLAEEVQVRAFFIGGVFYYISDDDLFKTQPIMTVDESSQGIDGIGFDYDIGKKQATVTINARIGRWVAPPGAVAVLQNMGPVNGRWLINEFERSLFDSAAEVQLSKPQPELLEPLDNQIQGIPSWALVKSATDPASTDAALFGGLPGTDGSRNAVVQVAEYALAQEAIKHYHYLQKRPMPASLFTPEAHKGIDCSAFVTLVYKEAGCGDPNELNFNGEGNTVTLAAHGRPRLVPMPGDLVFYGGTIFSPGHVAVYVGGNEVIEIGSDKGILRIDMNYRSDIVGVRSYLPL